MGREARVAMVNGHMLDATTEPGEYVAWHAPDVRTPAEWRELLGEDVESYAANSPHMIAWEVAPPAWRKATPDELADELRGDPIYNAAGEPFETRETPDGLEILDGTPAACGCIFHHAYMRGMWGFYCETEDNAYCNHECPHDDEEDGA